MTIVTLGIGQNLDSAMGLGEWLRGTSCPDHTATTVPKSHGRLRSTVIQRANSLERAIRKTCAPAIVSNAGEEGSGV